MMDHQKAPKLNSQQIFNRPTFLAIMLASFETQEFQFARQAGLSWLANYPGDLPISVLYAKSLVALNKNELAKSHLEKVINYDIEYIDALSLLITLLDEKNRLRQELIINLAYLTGKKGSNSGFANWLPDLLDAQSAFQISDYKQAEKHILNVMARNPQTPLPAIIHLRIVEKLQNASLLNTLTSIYSKRWPNSIQIRILSALSLINSGSDISGVENLHWSAAHDTTGQVVTRILGTNHKFKPLWPENTRIFMELPIPASVAVELGWNRLGNDLIDEEIPFEFAGIPQKANPTKAVDKEIFSNEQKQNQSGVDTDDHSIDGTVEHLHNEREEVIKSLNEIQSEFNKIAKNLKKSDILNIEGRFPSYIILTSKTALQNKYGENTANVIIDALQDLEVKISGLPNWSSHVFIPDDPKIAANLGMGTQLAIDPWKIKLSLVDLDKALASKGEMIGALLIIGGNDIIPFHQLPNPTDDSDLYVASDNPYATTDENYFVPQWPVGRIPDEAGSDATYLLEQVRFLNNEYSLKLKSKNLLSSGKIATFIQSIINVFRHIGNFLNPPENFGYAAEVWRVPSSEVFEIIGKHKKLLLSPPNDYKSISITNKNNEKCAYFNLHGLQDSAEWYGQKDFSFSSAEVDYPVALIPDQFVGSTSAPEFIFSEACYGAYIKDKTSSQSLALKFLEAGSRSVVGSTGIAYGSVKKPLIAADLLAREYWKHLNNGQTSGYALLQAKMSLAREMTERQGFLDGEDQKTILSFVLYGDPLASIYDLKQIPKPLYRPKGQPKFKTISDSLEETDNEVLDMPVEILNGVKSVVKTYLPGLENAQMNLNPQLSNFSLMMANDKKGKQKKFDVNNSQHYVITLKKSFERESLNHTQFTRMTFDHKGKMLKLSTSR